MVSWECTVQTLNPELTGIILVELSPFQCALNELTFCTKPPSLKLITFLPSVIVTAPPQKHEICGVLRGLGVHEVAHKEIVHLVIEPAHRVICELVAIQ